MNLNDSARVCAEGMIAEAERFRVAVRQCASGARIIDCGVYVPGGLEAGRRMAEVCMAGRADVQVVCAAVGAWRLPGVMVRTDHPVEACMASQYAGWRIALEGYFAMGSGPMRVRARKEPLFDKIDYREDGSTAVGVLETAQLPTPAVCSYLAEECGIAPSGLTLLVARTASQAGGVQIVARSVETAMHKLMESGFDLRRVESGFGVAPLPPVAKDDLSAIGRTNDAILYGGEVTLWVRGDDDSLAQIGPGLPSAASPDHAPRSPNCSGGVAATSTRWIPSCLAQPLSLCRTWIRAGHTASAG